MLPTNTFSPQTLSSLRASGLNFGEISANCDFLEISRRHWRLAFFPSLPEPLEPTRACPAPAPWGFNKFLKGLLPPAPWARSKDMGFILGESSQCFAGKQYVIRPG